MMHSDADGPGEKMESTLNIKWWGVLIVLFTMIGWLTLGHIGQGDRLTALETCNIYISKQLDNMTETLKLIRQDQLDRKAAQQADPKHRPPY